MIDAPHIRKRIAEADIETGRMYLGRMVRRHVRGLIRRHADRFDIRGFADGFVGERHRQWEASIRQDAQGRLQRVANAVTVEQLLIVFDAIADEL